MKPDESQEKFSIAKRNQVCAARLDLMGIRDNYAYMRTSGHLGQAALMMRVSLKDGKHRCINWSVESMALIPGPDVFFGVKSSGSTFQIASLSDPEADERSCVSRQTLYRPMKQIRRLISLSAELVLLAMHETRQQSDPSDPSNIITYNSCL